MIRRFFQLLAPSMPTRSNQFALLAASLAFGLVYVLLASAFILNQSPEGILPGKADRIFQVQKWVAKADGERLASGKTAGLIAPVLAANLPEVEGSARLMGWPEEVTLTGSNRSLPVKHWTFADPGFLSLFEVEFLRGHAQAALSIPGQLILTESVARKLFGTLDVLGKPLLGLGGKIYTVSGVVRNPSAQSKQAYDVLASWSSTTNTRFHDFRFMNNWTGQTVETYLLLRTAAAAPATESQIPQLIGKQIPGKCDFFLQPLLESAAKTGALELKKVEKSTLFERQDAPKHIDG
ncbi:MAG: ABC transporter permease [Saprospiraceae bacterium]|nr:ABC transporter permease [Saprospiraceae bacterium]